MTDCKIHAPIAIRHLRLPPLPNTSLSNIYQNYLQASVINEIISINFNNILCSDSNVNIIPTKNNIKAIERQHTNVNITTECRHGANCKIYSKSHRQKFVHPPIDCPHGDRCRYYKNNECIFIHNKN